MPRVSNYPLKIKAFWAEGRNRALLAAFFFFLSYPILIILFSFSLYLFLALLFRLRRVHLLRFRPYKYSTVVILLFAVSALISTLFAPASHRESDYNPFIVLIQYFYWAILAVILMQHARNLPYYQLAKYITWGLLLLTLNFFLFNDFLDLRFLSFYINRNTYTYVMLCFFPISTWYVHKSWGKKGLWLYLATVLMLMLLTNGRSAGILIFLEIILLVQAYSSGIQKIMKALTIAALVVVGVSSIAIDTDQARNAVGGMFDNVSPRLAEFIKGSGSAGDLETDKSWLVRELMVQKGLEISKNYPVLGIGPLKFASYDASLSALYSYEFRNLYVDHYGLQYYNKKSAHNSYIMVLAEQGVVGFVLFLLIVLPLLWHLLKKILFSSIEEEDVPLIAMMAISMHFYAIASMPSAITWVVIGLSYGRYHRHLKLKTSETVVLQS